MTACAPRSAFGLGISIAKRSWVASLKMRARPNRTEMARIGVCKSIRTRVLNCTSSHPTAWRAVPWKRAVGARWGRSRALEASAGRRAECINPTTCLAVFRTSRAESRPINHTMLQSIARATTGEPFTPTKTHSWIQQTLHLTNECASTISNIGFSTGVHIIKK